MRNSLLTFLALAGLSMTAAAQLDTTTYEAVERNPVFYGCDIADQSEKAISDCSMKQLQTFLSQNLVYPDTAIGRRVEGTVLVSFVIDQNGNTTQVGLKKDIGEGCGREALRVVKAFPLWTPALIKNKPVKMRMVLPIRFNLKSVKDRFSKISYAVNWGTCYENSLSKTDIKKNQNVEILVRDSYGTQYEILALRLVHYTARGDKATNAPTGKLTSKMKKMLSKAKPAARFKWFATIEDGTGRRIVEKEFTITQ